MFLKQPDSAKLRLTTSNTHKASLMSLQIHHVYCNQRDPSNLEKNN